MEIVHLEETENHFLFQNISGISVRSFLESFWISKKLIYKLERSKALTVNAETVGFDFVLQSRDVIKISLEEFEKETLIPHEGPLTVIYEDADLLLVNKPPGILVHPDGTGKLSLDNLVAHHYLRKGLKRKARHAYRLDYHASGLLLYPKHFLAAAHINHQLEYGMMKKLYYAVVEGKVERGGAIDLRIGRDRHRNNRYRVSKTALTYYRVLQAGEKRSLLEIEIKTGRRHQIRVHFSHLGHPLVGDGYYGKKGERLMLHAFYLSFQHPRTGERKEFVLPLPKEFTIRS